MSDINDILLTELREMRSDMNEGFSSLLQRTSAIETQVNPFFETDGGKDKIQEQIDDLKRTKWIAVGGAVTISGIISTIAKKMGF